MAHYYLGNIYLDTEGPENLDKALTQYQHAVEVDPKFALPYEGLGRVYYAQGLYPKAIQAFKQYLQLAPRAEDREVIQRYIEELKSY